jgi:hypothetical protein
VTQRVSATLPRAIWPGMSAKPARQTRVTSELAWLLVTTYVEGALFVPNRYPEEFRRKVLDLVAAGRPVAQVAADLAISDQTIYD